MQFSTTPSEYGGLFPPPKQVFNINRVSRLWRLLTISVAIVLLTGYLMLAVVFGDSNTDVHIDETTTIVIALFFIALSYAASLAIAFFQRQRKLFLLHSLFLPYTIVNLLALFNVLLNIFARNLRPLSPLRVVATGLPSAFILIYGCASLLIYLEFGSMGSIRAADGTPLLNEEEMQRRQLARLLEERSAPQPSPDLVRSTYRLEIPTLDPVQKPWDRNEDQPLGVVSRPQHTNQSWSSVSQSMI
ncbi:hypothetical protein N7478_011513 [Penicillium angulare]|uniref:uncharacterized protein n=1 Tax=Penicillium angulare TaxID=116970 RepID=UPI00253FE441|nr:uncharacterized protein N7478_011513 [Penicillium angulare]KAJ5263908.1 hypothetical protein N7478_011513 [Penicillium angulare]